jgi:regulator of cell morphogenesis and NO signaling
MEKVERVHGPNHPEVLPELARLYRRLAWDLEQHMAKEEEVLFPAIRALEAGGPSRIHCGHLSSPIRVMEWEHDECGRILARMREVTRDYALPEGACGSFAALYGGLAAMEADLHAHIHLENHLVHPRALALADGACAHGIG